MRLVHVRAEHYSHKHITTKPLQSSTQIVIVYAQNKMQKNAHTHTNTAAKQNTLRT